MPLSSTRRWCSIVFCHSVVIYANMPRASCQAWYETNQHSELTHARTLAHMHTGHEDVNYLANICINMTVWVCFGIMKSSVNVCTPTKVCRWWRQRVELFYNHNKQCEKMYIDFMTPCAVARTHLYFFIRPLLSSSINLITHAKNPKQTRTRQKKNKSWISARRLQMVKVQLK